MAAPLLPVKDLRRVKVRCCGTCRYGNHDGTGSFVCNRQGGPIWDSGDGYEWEHVCDRFVRHEHKEEE